MARTYARRHRVLLTDQEVLLNERALLAYAKLIQIQTSASPKQEADDTARLASVVQAHRRCTCPSPVEGDL